MSMDTTAELTSYQLLSKGAGHQMPRQMPQRLPGGYQCKLSMQEKQSLQNTEHKKIHTHLHYYILFTDGHQLNGKKWN